MMLSSFTKKLCFLPYSRILNLPCSKLLANTVTAEHNLARFISTDKPFCTNVPNLTLSRSQGDDSDTLKEIANSYKNRADEQDSMTKDVYYEQFTSGAKLKTLEVRNGKEHLLNDADDSTTDSHSDELESEEMDFSEDARLLLKAIKFVGPKAGVSLSCLLLTGSEGKRLWPRMKKSNLYGSGKDKSKDYWMALVGALVDNKYLEKIIQVGVITELYHGYKLSRLGMIALNKKDSVFKMRPTRELKLIIYKLK